MPLGVGQYFRERPMLKHSPREKHLIAEEKRKLPLIPALERRYDISCAGRSDFRHVWVQVGPYLLM